MPITVYTSIDDVPVDTDFPPDVGDLNSAPGKLQPPRQELVIARPAATGTAGKFIIPFTHTLELGSIGNAVKGAKRALSHAGYIKWGVFTSEFGPFAVIATKSFQKAKGVPETGKIDEATLKVLAPYFDAYGFLLYVGYSPGQTKEETMRNAIVAYALWGYNHNPSNVAAGQPYISYEEIRPMEDMDNLYDLPVDEDCSTFGTKAFKFGNAPDPNDEDYNGIGNTSTMQVHGIQVANIQAALLAALILYGFPIEHVAVYVGGLKVVSHGSQGGPRLLPYNYRSDVNMIRDYISN